MSYCSIILSLSPSAIPRQLLDKIDHTLSLAHTHNLPTVTPTQVFNHLELAYQYGRLVPNAYYESHIPALDEYDKTFMSYVRSLVDGEEDRLREELKKCELYSGTWYCMHYVYNLMSPLISEKAVEEAVRNCEQLKRREQEEDNVTIEELEKQRVEALEVVEKEREIVLCT